MAGVIAGLIVASIPSKDPVRQLEILQVIPVTTLAGLAGIEGVFFAGAARLAGYGEGSPYQRQSAMNNLALGLVSVAVFIGNWDAARSEPLYTIVCIPHQS